MIRYTCIASLVISTTKFEPPLEETGVLAAERLARGKQNTDFVQ
jgi:hypothetical protein